MVSTANHDWKELEGTPSLKNSEEEQPVVHCCLQNSLLPGKTFPVLKYPRKKQLSHAWPFWQQSCGLSKLGYAHK